MGLSTSILAYKDCEEFLDRALDDAKGARIPFRSESEANYWRMRANQFRSLDRERNMQIHSPGHKMHGHSPYDELSLTIKQSPDGYFWVYAQKISLDPGLIENLSEVDDPPLQITVEEIRLLENHNGDETTS